MATLIKWEISCDSIVYSYNCCICQSDNEREKKQLNKDMFYSVVVVLVVCWFIVSICHGGFFRIKYRTNVGLVFRIRRTLIFFL
jgi:hypothetical protein